MTMSAPNDSDPRSIYLDSDPCTHRSRIGWTRTLGIFRTQGRTQVRVGQVILVTDYIRYWDYYFYIWEYILRMISHWSFDWFLFTI